MPDEKAPEESDHLSPQDMRAWGEQEIRDSAKAHELRVQELTDLMTAYDRREISPEEAAERNWRYQHRWEEALPGASAQMSDEDILKRIDEARGPLSSLRGIRETYAKNFGRRAGGTGEPSR